MIFKRKIVIFGFGLACLLGYQDFTFAPSSHPRAVLNRPRPFSGSILEVANGNVHGWAINTETPDDTITLQMDIDGQSQPTFQAGDADAIAAEAFGSNSAHGFTMSVGSIQQGSHQVELYAIDGPLRRLLQTVTITNGAL